MSLLDKASIVWPKGAPSKAGNLAAWNPQTSQLVEFDVVRATTKTYVDEDGLIQTAATNVLPRDFTDGGCGVQKVEPQRTNLFTYSEQFDNRGWNKFSTTVTANDTTAPDGNTTADKLIADNGLSLGSTFADQNLSCSSSTTYSVSVYGKEAEFDQIQILVRDGATFANRAFSTFSIVDGSIVVAASDNGDFTAISSSTKLVNGFYRCTLIFTTGGSTATFRPRVYVSDSTATQGDGTSGIYVWGAQIEEGSYQTSYIKTEASTATRNADVPSLSSAAALLGDSEGGIFIEASWYVNNGSGWITINDDDDENRIFIFPDSGTSQLRFGNTVSGATVGNVENASYTIATDGTFYKIAGRYALNDLAAYIDGNLIGTDTSVPIYPDGTLTDVDFHAGINNLQFYGEIRQIVIFDQAPTDAQLSAITS